jgi:hypothetical protein
MEEKRAIRDLLIRQLNQELLVATQAAYFSGIAKTSSLKEQFLKFACEELEHFAKVANILDEMGHTAELKPVEIEFEKDELKALIILSAMEDTIIHLYGDILSDLEEPFKSTIRDQIQEEFDHKNQMEHLLEEAKIDRR